MGAPFQGDVRGNFAPAIRFAREARFQKRNVALQGNFAAAARVLAVLCSRARSSSEWWESPPASPGITSSTEVAKPSA
jgi:hypothetical protein